MAKTFSAPPFHRGKTSPLLESPPDEIPDNNCAVLMTGNDQVGSRRDLDARRAVGGLPLFEQRTALKVVDDEEVGLDEGFILKVQV